ncbi:HNH endonuclease [Bacillus infantis]|uniref:HNH endonuclease n=1 Tax=Bacillus infantis TaxID=324767 RepID=UPI00209DA5F9|nr:HNH endonuclease [Bacillus infantis]MCP1159279.1 HNH endonuclease [Bacillus infantis]
MSICNVKDCENPVRAKKFCSGHYYRLEKYGDPLATSLTSSKKNMRPTLPYEMTHKDIDGLEHKLCRECEKFFPMNSAYFYKKKTSDGFDSYCKPCASKRAKRWCDNNPEITKASKRKYNKSPKGRPKLAANAKRRRENGEFNKWVKDNREYLSEYHKDKRINRTHSISSEEWSACKLYFNDSCAYCGVHVDDHLIKYAGEFKHTDLHKEHVIHMGANDLSNCVPSCQKCNSSKWAKEFNDFYNLSNPTFTEKRLEKIIKWLEEDHKKYIVCEE